MSWRVRQAIALAIANSFSVWVILHFGPPYRELPWAWLSCIWFGTIAIVIEQIRERRR
jgi:hypothetical protein